MLLTKNTLRRLCEVPLEMHIQFDPPSIVARIAPESPTHHAVDMSSACIAFRFVPVDLSAQSDCEQTFDVRDKVTISTVSSAVEIAFMIDSPF
jgi:hypothetical protein